jgi:hypothetical protein
VRPTARFLFGEPPAVRGAKRNTALTAILLASDDPELTVPCLARVDKGEARIDENLVLNLYAAGNPEARLALAGSVAVGRMKPRAFRKIFDAVYARSDLTIQQRSELVWNLDCFLALNPRQFPAYAPTLLELLRSPSPYLRDRALSIAGGFNRLEPAALAILARHLRSRIPGLRVNALDGFFALIERFDDVAPHIRDFIVSEGFREQVARMQRTDPDEAVRHNAWAVLGQLRRTTGAATRPKSRAKPPRPPRSSRSGSRRA